MSVCGYHPLMGEGLRTFARGLLFALQEKAHRKSRSIHEHMFAEGDEITILTNFVEKMRAAGQAPEVASGFLGIIYACHCMMGDPVKLAKERDDLQATIDGNTEALINFLQAFEDSFEQCTDPSALSRTRVAWEDATRPKMVKRKLKAAV